MFKKFLSFILSVALSTSMTFTTYANKGDCYKNPLRQTFDLGPNRKAVVEYIPHRKIEQMLKDARDGKNKATWLMGLMSLSSWLSIFNKTFATISPIIPDEIGYWEDLLKISNKGKKCGVAIASIGDYKTLMSPHCDSNCAASIELKEVYKVAQPNSPDPRCVFYPWTPGCKK